MLRSLTRAAVLGLRVPWAQWSRNWAGVPAHVVDLRSDTVTRPGPAMRRAMAEAVVGDDDYGEDPTVHELQEKAAKMLGVERTLFVPTNTMANLISALAGVVSQCASVPGFLAALGTLDCLFLETASWHPGTLPCWPRGVWRRLLVSSLYCKTRLELCTSLFHM